MNSQIKSDEDDGGLCGSMNPIADVIARGEVVAYTAYILVGLSVFLLARMLMQEQDSRAAQENLDD